jgi:hypothetical protein
MLPGFVPEIFVAEMPSSLYLRFQERNLSSIECNILYIDRRSEFDFYYMLIPPIVPRGTIGGINFRGDTFK